MKGLGAEGRPAGAGGKALDAFEETQDTVSTTQVTEAGQGDRGEGAARARSPSLEILEARQEGEGNVSDGDEEEMGGGQPYRAHTPTGGGIRSVKMFDQLLEQSPRTKREIIDMMKVAMMKESGVDFRDFGGEKRGRSPESEGLITDADDAPDLFDQSHVAPHPQLVEMLHTNWHVPLTALTTEALKQLNRDASKLKTTKAVTKAQSTVRIIDLAPFGDEAKMCVGDWQEAWRNLLRILPRILGSKEVDRWREHYDFLIEHDDFRSDFPALLEFDIKLRTDWFTAERSKKPKFFVGGDKYCSALDRLQSKRLRVEVREREGRDAGRSDVRESQRPLQPGDRYHPYERGQNERAARGARPFQAGRSSASVGPLCLICGESGHTSPRCGRTTTVNNKPTHAVFSGGKLVTARTRIELCMGWNLGGIIPCKSRKCPGGNGCHTCSYCGAADHPASSKRCLGL
ncbi:hypothetical protein OH77DRAFT_1260219 [Trametes cingulata]|nr:hypothetical protein OH77DRAFT_1260219 [Trametes cingulata]